MPCEHFKDALIEAAASGAAPSGELRAHIDACASCRAAFDEEQSLFAAIDSGLHAASNVEVPPSLLPRVRASLEETQTPRFGWVQPLVFASAGVALVLAVFLMARPRHTTPENIAKEASSTPSQIAPATRANTEEISPEGTQIASVRVRCPPEARNSTNPHSAASGNGEVLVPPDEREAFARLVAALNGRSEVASSLLAKVPEKHDGLAAAAPLQIPDIEIKPLEGTEAQTSDGAAEKH